MEVKIKVKGKLVRAIVTNTEHTKDGKLYDVVYQIGKKVYNERISEYQIVNELTGMTKEEEQIELDRIMYGGINENS